MLADVADSCPAQAESLAPHLPHPALVPSLVSSPTGSRRGAGQSTQQGGRDAPVPCVETALRCGRPNFVSTRVLTTGPQTLRRPPQ